MILIVLVLSTGLQRAWEGGCISAIFIASASKKDSVVFKHFTLFSAANIPRLRALPM